ncbi:hypothetical protein GCM10009740_20280 [Terrabacter terrae]|uniref:Uncharacterized protein n=1 Tax=Terrabacter terrae TaxID=318434 RepID=A0ABN2U966_9MICO
MTDNSSADSRALLVDLLLRKVAADTYPSNTMMDYLEELLLPDEVPAYVAVLAQKVRDDTYPSISMLRRLVDLSRPA